jgi:hypothetical protein
MILLTEAAPPVFSSTKPSDNPMLSFFLFRAFSSACFAFSANDKTEFLDKLRSNVGSSSLVQNEKHPITGSVKVETRFQFTPSDLLHKLEEVGFEVTNIYPINYHAFNPIIVDDEVTVLRKQISEMISSNFQTDFRYLPNSSSYVMEAKK